jgi:uncharacterized membrane protein YeaQ/YmgE (transglycosylase-associated protein family)
VKDYQFSDSATESLDEDRWYLNTFVYLLLLFGIIGGYIVLLFYRPVRPAESFLFAALMTSALWIIGSFLLQRLAKQLLANDPKLAIPYLQIWMGVIFSVMAVFYLLNVILDNSPSHIYSVQAKSALNRTIKRSFVGIPNITASKLYQMKLGQEGFWYDKKIFLRVDSEVAMFAERHPADVLVYLKTRNGFFNLPWIEGYTVYIPKMGVTKTY